jgi:hypothetical protein
LGGQQVMEREIEIAGARYLERAYGWPDASVLIERPRESQAAGGDFLPGCHDRTA